MTGPTLEEMVRASDDLVTALLRGDVSRLEAAFATHEGCLRRLEGTLGPTGPGGPPRPTTEETALMLTIRSNLARARLLARQGLLLTRRLANPISPVAAIYGRQEATER
ncbi:MAG: hypothetical protein RDU89_02065 [bacterium]|nr:hypothetical protein [bacterium]